MSRDAFSYDPQEAGNVRDASARVSSRPRRSTPPDTRDTRNPVPDGPARADSTETRDHGYPVLEHFRGKAEIVLALFHGEAACVRGAPRRRGLSSDQICLPAA